MSLHLPHARIVPNLLQTAHDFANGSFGGFSFAGDRSYGGVSPISRAHALSQTSTLFLHEPPLRHKACATSYTSGSFPYKLDIGEWRTTCAGLPARITRFKSKVLEQTKKKRTRTTRETSPWTRVFCFCTNSLNDTKQIHVLFRAGHSRKRARNIYNDSNTLFGVTPPEQPTDYSTVARWRRRHYLCSLSDRVCTWGL